MKAQIIEINYRRGLYIFRREDDETGYFELLEMLDLEPEEILIGNFDDLGNQTVMREETNEKIDIFIEDFCTIEHAREMIY